MNNYYRSCRYSPRKTIGDDACPFTTLYFDFLERHRDRLGRNPRMRYPYMSLARKDRGELALIRRHAGNLKRRLTAETFL